MIQNLEKENANIAETGAEEAEKLRSDIEMLIKENDVETERLNEIIKKGKQDH